MKAQTKERAQELATELQRSTTREGDLIKLLVSALYEDAKDRLVDAAGDELLKVQGEARAYNNLFRQLTRPSPTASKE